MGGVCVYQRLELERGGRADGKEEQRESSEVGSELTCTPTAPDENRQDWEESVGDIGKNCRPRVKMSRVNMVALPCTSAYTDCCSTFCGPWSDTRAHTPAVQGYERQRNSHVVMRAVELGVCVGVEDWHRETI